MQLHATAPFYASPDGARVGRGVAALLAIVRFCRESSLVAYAGPLGLTRDLLESWVATGVLRRGMIRFDPLATSDEPYVALGTVGARIFSEVTCRVVRGFSTRAIAHGSIKRAHDVEVGDVALALLALGRDERLKVLGVDTDAKTIPVCTAPTRVPHGSSHTTLRPDAYVVVQGSNGPTALLVEVDRGTTPIVRMRAKYAGYFAWKKLGRHELDLGTKSVRVLTIAPTAARTRALHDAALDANSGRPSGFLLFARRDEVIDLAGAESYMPLVRALGAPDHDLQPLFNPPAPVRRTV